MAISALPTPPSTSDPSTFATKADALLSSLPTFVTEANALQSDVNAKQVTASTAAVDAVNAKNAAESFANATKWVSGTTYGEGDVVWSPINFKPYRRKTAGAGTNDPSLDTTNWSAVAYFDSEGADVASATTTDIWATDGNTRHVTGNVTITSFGTAPQAGARMKLIFDGTPQLTQSANLNLNAGGSNIIIEAGDWAEVYADTTTQFDVVVHRKSGAAVVTTNSVSQGNSSVTVTDAGTGKAETTIDGTIIEELTLASRKSTINGGSTLYPEFKCRAWANWNGTGTVAIRGSGNVSSITDNGGGGNYEVNLIEPMPDTNYATNVTPSAVTGTEGGATGGVLGGQTVSSVGVLVHVNSATSTPTQDRTVVNVAIFR